MGVGWGWVQHVTRKDGIELIVEIGIRHEEAGSHDPCKINDSFDKENRIHPS